MDDFTFRVEVVRTERKRSASIRLEGDLVKVSVPKTLSDNRVRALVNKRTTWIKTKLKEQSERPIVKPKEYISGESFPYLGKNYRLKVIRGNAVSLKLKSGYLQATVEETDVNAQSTTQSLLLNWYLAHAEKRLTEKTQRWADIIGVKPNAVSVKGYKSRWGSCSIQGDISYNWRIILAPHHIIDYVIIHELCHMLEHNHSARFWSHVEQYAPDWRDSRDWLKKNNLYF